MNDRDLTTWRMRVGLPASPPGPQGPPRCDLSASRVSLLDKCDLAYQMAKIDRLDERGDMSTRLRGLLCHRVLYAVGRPRLLGLRLTKPSQDELREALREEAARFRCSTGVMASAWDVLEDQADRLDFSCTIALEENIVVEIPQDAVAGPAFKLGGAVDRLDVRMDDLLQAYVLEIHDYKSGSFARSVSELLEDPQALFYVALVRSLGWSGPIRVAFHYLGAEQSTIFLAPDNMGQKGLDLAMTKMAEIRNKQEWKPSTGTHCVGCDFRYACPAYKKMLEVDGAAKLWSNDEELLREYVRCRTLEKMFGEHKSNCGDALKQRLQITDRVIGGGLRAIMVAKPKTRLPGLRTVSAVISQITGIDQAVVQEEICDVSDRLLKNFIGRLDEEKRAQVKEALDNLRETYDTTPSIDVREIAGGF